jgi:hypothetical protein
VHPSSMESCRRFVETYIKGGESVVDVGSYDVNGSYKELFSHCKYVGLDVAPGPNVDIVVTEDGDWCAEVERVMYYKFDIIISGQCLEHVRKPWQWIKQVESLSKPGTLLFITAPNTWGFHEYPIDCWRVFPDGLCALMEYGGFEVFEAYMTGENSYDTVGIGRKL